MLVRRIAVAGAVAVTTTLIACTSVLGDFTVGGGPVAPEAGADGWGYPDGSGCATDCSKLPNVTKATCGSDGKCAFSMADCKTGYADCNDQRDDGCEADLRQADNCGGCNRKCASPAPVCGYVNSSWSCTVSCTGTSTNCNGSCVELMTDLYNCGQCNNACKAAPHASVTCGGGQCQSVCDAGYMLCNGSCVDLRIDPNNCGQCGTMCGAVPNATVTCASGKCDSQCNNPYTICAGVCVDYATDASNCGTCGHSCQGGTCAAGVCKTVTLYASGNVAGGALALSSTSVFFSDAKSGHVYACPLAGCNGNPTLLKGGLGSAGSVAYDSKTNFVLVADTTVGTIFAYDTVGNFKWSAKSGGSSAPGVRGIFPDPNGYVFWGDNALMTSLFYRADSTTGGNILARSGPGGMGIMSLAYDSVSQNIYAAVKGSAALSYCPRIGPGSCGTVTTNQNPSGVSVANGTVFVAVDGSLSNSWSDGGIFAMKTNGNILKSLVSGNANYAPVEDSDLTTDALNVYWGGRDGNIYACAQAGCNNVPTKFSSGPYHPFAFANDANFVYWITDTGLYRQAK